MEKLNQLRELRKELLEMEFSYKNVQRIMYLLYATKSIFESASPLPNKEIALHQVNKIIKHDLMDLMTAEHEQQIQEAFTKGRENFKMTLEYIT